MFVIWKGPAFLIALGAALVAGLVFLGAVFAGMTPEACGITTVFTFSLVVIGADIRYRLKSELGLFSLEASTWFFVFPTWIVGIAFFLFSLLVAVVGMTSEMPR